MIQLDNLRGISPRNFEFLEKFCGALAAIFPVYVPQSSDDARRVPSFVADDALAGPPRVAPPAVQGDR